METNKGISQPKLELGNYIAGQETGITYQEVNPSSDWSIYLPEKESQNFNGFDTSACVTFSATNCLEIQLNYMANNKLISDEVIAKMVELKYIENGKFNFSDRFTAKLSGTTPLGNTLQNVWDSIRKDGLVPESLWPSAGHESWTSFYSEIPQEVKDFGKNILKYFDFKYEWIVTGNCGSPDLDFLKYHLKQSPLQVAHPLCGRDEVGQMKVCPAGVCMTQHATTIYNISSKIEDFDHYYPYLNQYPLNYTFPWVMKGIAVVKANSTVETPFNHVFEPSTPPIKYGQRSEEVAFLQKAYNLLGYKVPVTGFYGEITRSITFDFQTKFQVASLWDLLFLKGKVVGPSTKRKLNQLLK